MNIDGKTNQLVLQPKSTLTRESGQPDKATAVWHVAPYSAAASLAPDIGSAHPKHPHCKLKKCTITEAKGGAYVKGDFEADEGSEAGSAGFTVSGQPVLREAPITTNPEFTDWAGTQNAPLEGRFDAAGNFIGWVPTSDLFGQDTWLQPTMVVSVTTKEASAPSIGSLGRIVNSATGLPSAPGRNYMLTGIPYSGPDDNGEYTVTREYTASGPDKWNERVYG